MMVYSSNRDGHNRGAQMLENRCGCGRQIRYTLSDGYGACNKHGRCPSYDELTQINKELASDFSTLLSEVQTVLIYREGTKSYNEAFANIKVIAQNHGFEL